MKNNPRLTNRERGLIKGALRRVFSRSELRQRVIQASVVKHSDPKRGRVKTWCKCAVCGILDAKSNMAVDHIKPVIPIDTSFEKQGADKTINRLWCQEKDLQTICESCHDKKTALERTQRKLNKPKGVKVK